MTDCTCLACEISALIAKRYPDGIDPEDCKEVLAACCAIAGQVLSHLGPFELMGFVAALQNQMTMARGGSNPLQTGTKH